ncbi:hypothetical protein N0V90_005656 [Kalmusia sp. IMI 367209]|nr:hypothetical protein N0V90_005656 [Kalmusia sp. IMI 367209]
MAPNHPLRSSPPEIFVSPPTPVNATKSMYNIPRAISSAECITSPLIVISGYEPLTTTLTLQQLTELLPTLHIYIEPQYPSIALLPAAGVSYNGLKSALHWREADLEQRSEDMESTLPLAIEMYQALAFLGNKPMSRTLRLLERKIQGEIDEDLSLCEYQHLWELRHLPFTERFICAILAQLAGIDARITAIALEIGHQAQFNGDRELEALFNELLYVLSWVECDEELRQRVARMQEKMELQAKRERAHAKRWFGKSAVQGYRPALGTVRE